MDWRNWWVLLCLCMWTGLTVWFHFWLVEYTRWNVSSSGQTSGAALEVRFTQDKSCLAHGNFYSQQIESIDVIGGSSQKWEELISFPDSLTEKVIHVEDDDHVYFAVQADVTLVLPNYVVRLLSLSTLSRMKQTIAVFLENGGNESSWVGCRYNYTDTPGSHISLMNYVMLQGKQMNVAFFSSLSNASSSSLWSRSDDFKEWVCDNRPGLLDPHTQCAQLETYDAPSDPKLIVFMVVWAIFLLVSLTMFITFSVTFFKKVVVVKSRQIQPDVKKNDLNVENFVSTFDVLFMVKAPELPPASTTRLSALVLFSLQQYAIILLPAMPLVLASLSIACEVPDEEENCSRKDQVQFPLFYTTTTYLVFMSIQLFINLWEHNAKLIKFVRVTKMIARIVVFAFCMVAVCLLCSHALWMIVALTVRPVSAGSKILALLSIIIYARQTWKRMIECRQQVIDTLKKMGCDKEKIDQELLRKGFTQAQIDSFVFLSTSAFILLFVWLILCAIIFYAEKPGSESSFISFLLGFVIPVATSATHIFSVLKQRATIKSLSPVNDFIVQTASVADGANIGTDLDHIAQALPHTSSPKPLESKSKPSPTVGEYLASRAMNSKN